MPSQETKSAAVLNATPLSLLFSMLFIVVAALCGPSLVPSPVEEVERRFLARVRRQIYSHPLLPGGCGQRNDWRSILRTHSPSPRRVEFLTTLLSLSSHWMKRTKRNLLTILRIGSQNVDPDSNSLAAQHISLSDSDFETPSIPAAAAAVMIGAKRVTL